MKNRFDIIIATALVLLSFAFSPALVALEYDHSVKLDRMSFEWKLDGKDIHIRLKAKTTGWVAVGFNPENGMKGADFVIGYVKRGKVQIQDAFGTRRTGHIEDVKNNGKNDIKNVSGSEKGGYTTLAFTIPLKSGDHNDSVINVDSPTKVLLAFGPKKDSFSTRHIFRTALTVDLKTGNKN